ncbi:MAG: ATP-dependent protease subunit HslV [Armatimonadetes bacterium]|nr:ATP-dependent protease subunit HslV [Armatimonadota bacterium]
MSLAQDKWHGTTILVVKRDGVTAMGGDGQITLGNVALKHGAQKIRTMRDGQVLAGYAGAAADAMALFERLEGKLEEYAGNLQRAAVELVKLWRTDRVLRRLEAMLVVADRDTILLISGAGELIRPDDPVLGIGSGGPYAEAAARALIVHSGMSAPEICRAALEIAARLCIYTNDNITVQTLE